MQPLAIPGLHMWSHWQPDRGMFFSSYLLADGRENVAFDPLPLDAAQESQVAVLPVVLQGLGEMRAGGRWVRSGKLRIHVGTPVVLGREASAAEWTEALEAVVREMFGAGRP